MLDAERRVTAAKALTHPYFESLHDTEDEPTAQKYDESFDDVDRMLDEWKREWGALGRACGWTPPAPCRWPGLRVLGPPTPGCRLGEEHSGGRGSWASGPRPPEHLASPGPQACQRASPCLGQRPGYPGGPQHPLPQASGNTS